MDTLKALLQSIVANSRTSDPTWWVLADWLEENDPDPRRADLLRWHRRLLDTYREPDRHVQRGAWQARVVELFGQGVRPCVPQRTLSLGQNLGMTFAWIPPGSFLMGSPASERERNHDETQHPVTLTKGYYLGIHPVTQAQWQAVMGEVLPVEMGGWENFRGEHLPVEVEYLDGCQDFCTKLGEMTGEQFRLPTEAEWEYACQAGTTTPFWCGETLSTAQAHHGGNNPCGACARRTTPVQTFSPNPWGLFGMHDYVWEWCQDSYEAEFYQNTNIKDPVDLNEAHTGHARRGGPRISWSLQCCSANRRGDDVVAHAHYLGFRVVAGTGGLGTAADPG